MKKLSLLAAAWLAAALLLSGCSMFMEKEYLSISPHLEQRAKSTQESYLEADNFNSLKSAIIRLIRSGAEQGVIRCYGSYPGDLSRDLPNAIYEVMKQEPIGSYAVEYIPYEAPVHFPAYYEMRLSITYGRTKQQIDSIVSVEGEKGLKEELKRALLSFKGGVVVEIPYYDEAVYDVDRLVRELTYENPEISIGLPVPSTKLYPDEGFNRILDISVVYSADAVTLLEKSRQVSLVLAKTVKDAQAQAPADQVLSHYNFLRKQVQYDQTQAKALLKQAAAYKKTDSSTLFGSLCAHLALPEGYALAFKKLCDLSGIECLVVSGQYNSSAHYWNIVELDGVYRHVDVSMGLTRAEKGQTVYLETDTQMPEKYKWDTQKYPQCAPVEPSGAVD